MSKRKPATASKPPRSKIAAKAQRAKHAIVRSSKDSLLASVAADLTESPAAHHSDSEQEVSSVENRATALRDGYKHPMRDNDPNKGLDFSSATATVQAYQAKLLEMAQANIQFAFEFAQRLATIRSPVDIFSVIAEFTSKRIAMFGKYSKDLNEISTMR
jgi:hypothetical protein